MANDGGGLVTKSCLTLVTLDCSPLGSSVHCISQARILQPFSLQGIFLTKGSNLGLLHCRQSLALQPDSLPLMGFPGGSDGRVCRKCGKPGFDPWVGKIPWRRKRQPIPVFLPGKYHGQRSLVGCTPWHLKKVRHDMETKITSSLELSPLMVLMALPSMACVSLTLGTCGKSHSAL